MGVVIKYTTSSDEEKSLTLDDNAEDFYLSDSSIRTIDLTPLSSCTGLKSFGLGQNTLESIDLSPLSSCVNLEHFNLFYSPTPISFRHRPRAKPTRWKVLTLGPWSMRFERIDLTPLGSCTNLRSIHLGSNRIRDIDLTPLSSCTNLEIFDLDQTDVENVDLSPLSSCTNLLKLYLRSNELKSVNLSPLSSCTALEHIDVSGNQLRSIDLTPLASLTNLLTLLLHLNRIEEIDLSPLSSCTNLKKLLLTGNQLVSIDLEPLARCADLVTLDLGHQRIIDIDLAPLSTCTELRSLELQCNELQTIDLSPLRSCSELYHLFLNDNQLQTIDLAPLGSGPNLIELHLEGNEFQDIDLSPLISSFRLQKLYIGDIKRDATRREERYRFAPKKYIDAGELSELEEKLVNEYVFMPPDDDPYHLTLQVGKRGEEPQPFIDTALGQHLVALGRDTSPQSQEKLLSFVSYLEREKKVKGEELDFVSCVMPTVRYPLIKALSENPGAAALPTLIKLLPEDTWSLVEEGGKYLAEYSFLDALELIMAFKPRPLFSRLLEYFEELMEYTRDEWNTWEKIIRHATSLATKNGDITTLLLTILGREDSVVNHFMRVFAEVFGHERIVSVLESLKYQESGFRSYSSFIMSVFIARRYLERISPEREDF